MLPAILRQRCLCAALLATHIALPAVRSQESAPASSKAISRALQPLVDSHCLAGAVTLVADKDRVLSQNAVGYADIAAGKPMTADAIFWIASQSKPITATALMMLVDEGKLDLDDPVEKHLPEFHHQWLAVEQDSNHLLLKQPKRPITVRDILSHTSGLPFASAAEQPTLDLLPLRVGVLQLRDDAAPVRAGKQVSVLQRRHQHRGPDYRGQERHAVRGFSGNRLFGPLGMNDTTFWPSSEQCPGWRSRTNPARTERTRGDDRYPAQVPAERPHAPAHARGRPLLDGPRPGAVLPDDLERRGLRGQTLSLPGRRGRADPKRTPDPIKEGYGLGWATSGGSFGHGGAYSTGMSIDRDHGLIYVFMVQHAGFPGNGGTSYEAFKKAAAEEFGKQGR